MTNNTIDLTKRISPVIAAPPKAINPDYIRGALEAYIRAEIAEYPEAGAVVPEFWQKLTTVIGDEPGSTWDMRWGSKDHFCPVIYSKQTAPGKPKILVYILTGNGIRFEIKKDALPAKYEKMFPIHDSMYGTCRAVQFEYNGFGNEIQEAYLKVIRELLSKPA